MIVVASVYEALPLITSHLSTLDGVAPLFLIAPKEVVAMAAPKSSQGN